MVSTSLFFFDNDWYPVSRGMFKEMCKERVHELRDISSSHLISNFMFSSVLCAITASESQIVSTRSKGDEMTSLVKPKDKQTMQCKVR